MTTIQTIEHAAFGRVTEVQTVAGSTVHFLYEPELGKAAADLYATASDVIGSGIVGYYADTDGMEVMRGEVWEHEVREEVTYYAVVRSNDSDSVYVDAETYADMQDAAHGAQSLAESIATSEREYREVVDVSAEIRQDMRMGASCIREGILLRRRLDDGEGDAELREVAARLVRQGKRTRRMAWDRHGEHDTATAGWAEGWDVGA